ncbi:OsmC family protein [Halovulum sp. GXIMD14794]
MKRKASAVWTGDLKNGEGTVSSASGVLDDTRYGFKSRFEEGPGTNPEELIGAAHAGCFSMALSAILGEQGVTPERIETSATVSLEKVGDGFEVTKIHLDVSAKIAGIDDEAFQNAAAAAKAGCPISKLLKAEISMDAKLA